MSDSFMRGIVVGGGEERGGLWCCTVETHDAKVVCTNQGAGPTSGLVLHGYAKHKLEVGQKCFCWTQDDFLAVEPVTGGIDVEAKCTEKD